SVVPRNPSLEDQMARGNVFAGTPDQVYEQIKTLYEYAGGFGHLIVMGQAGFLTMAEALGSMKVYSKEGAPCLTELVAPHDQRRRTMSACRNCARRCPIASLLNSARSASSSRADWCASRGIAYLRCQASRKLPRLCHTQRIRAHDLNYS